MLPQVLAEGKGGRATDRLKEAGAQKCELTNRNRIQGLAPGRHAIRVVKLSAVMEGINGNHHTIKKYGNQGYLVVF
jgi:hypothetical protein